MLFAAGANATHGLRRKPEDTRRAVALALRAFAEKGHKPTNPELGEVVGVSEFTARKYRPHVEHIEMGEPDIRTRRNGTTYTVPPRPAPAEPAEDTTPITGPVRMPVT